jgi:hypothetical protein
MNFAKKKEEEEEEKKQKKQISNTNCYGSGKYALQKKMMKLAQ